MEPLTFKIHINAPVEKVWHTMLDDETYRIWTAEFNPGSYYEGNWEKGSKISFIGPDPQDPTKSGGILGEIADNRKYEFVSIKYTGLIMDGVEDTTSDMVKEWAGSTENYTFTPSEGGTDLLVEIDVEEQNKEMFAEMWPKALNKLKEMCEA